MDVEPDGKAIIICEGIVRASFRESLEHPKPIELGRAYAYTISLWETSNLFKAGHYIRLEISSSCFPRFNRNLNTGEHTATGTTMATARQVIYHTLDHPSHIVLPVIRVAPDKNLRVLVPW